MENFDLGNWIEGYYPNIKSIFRCTRKDKSQKELTRHQVKMMVPFGCYCYDGKGNCPFWDKMEEFGHQSDGYCHLIQRGDFMASENDGTFLLWDQCKECGVNTFDSSEAVI